MKKLFSLLAVAAIAALTFAHSPPGSTFGVASKASPIVSAVQDPGPAPGFAIETLATYKDSKVSFTQTVTYPLFTAENVLRIKGLNADIRLFTGTEISGPETGSFAYGGVAAIRFPDLLAKGVDVGVGGFFRQDNHSAGVYFSVARRF